MLYSYDYHMDDLQNSLMTETTVKSSNFSFIYVVKASGMVACVVLVLLVLIFGILNYFNLISISKLYPNVFGLLPHQPFPHTQEMQPTSPATDLQNLVLPCPLQLDPCPVSERIPTSVDDPNFQGLGYSKIASDTAVIAVFDGTYQSLEQKMPTGLLRTSISIFDAKGIRQATYIFQGLRIKSGSGQISKGDAIGKLGQDTVGKRGYYKEYNLIFSLQDIQNNLYLRLEPSIDRKSLQII